MKKSQCAADMVFRVPCVNDSLVSSCGLDTVLPSPNCTHPGHGLDLLIFILRQYLLPDATVLCKSADGYGLERKTVSNFSNVTVELSVLDQIFYGTADATIPNMELQSSRIELLSYLENLHSLRRSMLFLTKRLASNPPMVALTTFLSLDVLLSVFLTTVFIILTQHIVGYFEKYSSCNILLLINKFKVKAAVIFLFWYGIFLGHLSSKVVLLFNVKSVDSTPIRNFNDLVEQLEAMSYACVTWYPYVSLFPEDPKTDLEVRTVKLSVVNPPVLVDNLIDGVNILIRSEKPMVAVFDSSYLLTFYQNFCEQDFELRVDPYFPELFYTMYFNKILANVSLSFVDSELIRQESDWITNKYRNYNACYQRDLPNNSDQEKSVAFSQLQSIFLVLFIIYGACIVVLVIEKSSEVLASMFKLKQLEADSFCLTIGKIKI